MSLQFDGSNLPVKQRQKRDCVQGSLTFFHACEIDFFPFFLFRAQKLQCLFKITLGTIFMSESNALLEDLTLDQVTSTCSTITAYIPRFNGDTPFGIFEGFPVFVDREVTR